VDIFNTHFELKESGTDVAILPVGSIEQHTRHLPLGTDSIIAWHVSRRVSRALEEEGCEHYLLPPVVFATSLEHKGFVGTVTLKPPTLAMVIKDIVTCLYEHGFRIVFVLNFHGGNFILKPTVREINYDNPGRKVVLLDGWDAVPPAEMEGLFETPDLHSGESETSVMLAIDEKLVREERVDFVPEDARPVLDMYSFKEVTPEGVWGVPSKASKEKGERYLELKVKYTVKAVLRWIRRCREHPAY